VVVVPDLGRRFNLEDIKRRVIADRRAGLGLRVADARRGIRYPTARYLLLRAEKRRESLAEELRLLYVAFTRARKRLVMVGSGDGEELRLRMATRDPSECIPDYALLRGRDPLTWLARAFGRLPAELLSVQDEKWETCCAAWFHARVAALARAETGRPDEEPGDPGADPVVARQVRILKRSYPYAEDTRRRAVFPVTQLKPGVVRPEAEEPSRFEARRPLTDLVPEFVAVETDGVGAAAKRRGVLVHRFLQYADLAAADPEADFDRLAARGTFRAEEKDAVDFDAVRWFRDTALGRRIRAHPERVRRELPFLARLGATDSPVLVRGVVDGVIVEEDSLTIFDFKTDRVEPAALVERTAHYRPQLLAYAWALGEIWGCPAAAAYVVFLTPRTLVPIEGLDADPELLRQELLGLAGRQEDS
jgi:ATP-dependent helicase/nuclease subunit A